MKITFVGVGEACDPAYPNTSLLLETQGDKSCQVLLDCGFTVPHHYFACQTDPGQLDVVWISHFHGDHFFGLPLLLLRFWEAGRKKLLTITGQPGIQKKIYQIMELAYPGFMAKLGFALEFVEFEPGRKQILAGLHWQVAESQHSKPSLVLRLEKNGAAFYYSGDGRPTAAAARLAQGCRLIVHEAYDLEDKTPGHASIGSAIAFSRQAGAAQLALVHLGREQRKRLGPGGEQRLREQYDYNVVVPEPGYVMML